MTEITHLTLDNGLKILLKEIHTAPLISQWIWYRVGSKDEAPGQTGISHWTEHMQFKGTDQFPPTVLDREIDRCGGNWNAFTFLDWTAYYETMPSAAIDLALRLEADRMTGSHFDPDEVESERTVIISEREGSENEPAFRLSEAVQQACFNVHPYRHDVIGDMADLETITRNQLYQHYQHYYQPNNAVLTLAGDFSTPEMITRLQQLYAHIPTGPAPRRLQLTEPEPNSETRLQVEGPGGTTFMQIAYPIPGAAHADFHALTVLSSLLSGAKNLSMFGGGGITNKTSRLYRAIVDRELAVGVHGGLTATIDPFLYTFTLTGHPTNPLHGALSALDDELSRLQNDAVPAEEITRAIKQARALFHFGAENITNQASWLGYSEMFATSDWFTNYLENLSQVTPSDVQRVAQTYFVPGRRVVGTYIPTGLEEEEE